MSQTSVQSSSAEHFTHTHPHTSDSDSQWIIKCAGLTKVFRDFWLRNRVRAVDEIDLDVQRGEVFGLLGPNGSGKSTTIKMILGLLHPTAGRIAVFGKHPSEVSIKQDIGYLPEETYLYRFLNGRETLDYYARLFHQDRRQRRKRIDMLLEMVGLDKVARRPVGEYSKGMQRRIGLAQALINDPQLLILDEPTTGLDPLGTRQIKDLILQLRQRGKTILLSSHLLADVEDVTGRVAVMFGGKIRRSGQMEELLKRRDQTTVTLPAMDEQTQQRVMASLESAGITNGRFDTPRQKLEQFFLDIVEEARQAGLATSGAGAAGQIAAFLAGDQDQSGWQEAQGQAVISQLVESKTDEPQPQPTPTPPPEAPSQGADSDVIDDLTRTHQSTPASKEPDRDESRQDESRQDQRPKQADQGVIDDLMSE